MDFIVFLTHFITKKYNICHNLIMELLFILNTTLKLNQNIGLNGLILKFWR